MYGTCRRVTYDALQEPAHQMRQGGGCGVLMDNDLNSSCPASIKMDVFFHLIPVKWLKILEYDLVLREVFQIWAVGAHVGGPRPRGTWG